jgi:hypothetical protein
MSTSRPTRPATRPAAGHVTRAPGGPEPLETRRLLSGLSATYYDNPDFTGTSVTRVDATVNFDWSRGSPDPRIGPDSFSAQWTGQVRSAYSEQYTFNVQADDAVRLWVNGQLLIDKWNGGASNVSGKITLEAGRLNDIILQYREDTGGAKVKLLWSSASQPSQIVPTNMLYPPSTPATPLPQLVPNPTMVSARDFGARGNGTSDDAGALQHAIDATPAYGTLVLEPRTYKLNTGLVIDKPMEVAGNGALLLLNTSVSPVNRTLTIRSELSPTSVSWKEPVTAGQSTFHPAFTAGTFKVGQWVFVELGQDPYDHNEQHYTTMAPVTAVGTNTLTLGTSVPYNINAGAFTNKITPVTSMASQVHVRDLKFDHVAGTIPDASIWMERVRNSTIDGISGRFEIMATMADCANVSLTNATASLVNDHSAAGRALTVWQSDNTSFSNIHADTSVDKAVFFVESWARNTTLTNLDVRWRYTLAPQNAVFHLTGGSIGTLADGVRINNTGPVMLAMSGTQPADYHFGTVNVSGPLKAAWMRTVDDLTVGTKRFANAVHVTKTIDLAGGWNGKNIDLVRGAIKSIKVTATKANSVSQVFVLNPIGQGTSVKTPPAGVAVDLPTLSMLTSDASFNDLSDSLKRTALITPTSVPLGSKLTFDIEYYPASQ